jgi:hypothetical protein
MLSYQVRLIAIKQLGKSKGREVISSQQHNKADLGHFDDPDLHIGLPEAKIRRLACSDPSHGPNERDFSVYFEDPPIISVRQAF